MKIIKDKKIVDDNWSHLADDEAISQGDITVSLSRWKDEKSSLRDHAGKIGIRLAPADHWKILPTTWQTSSSLALNSPHLPTDGPSLMLAYYAVDISMEMKYAPWAIIWPIRFFTWPGSASMPFS